jgi:peroxiredoxin
LPGEWGITFVFYLVVIFISVFNYRNLPAIDFRPYKIGTDIPSSMIIPDDAEKGEIESIFIYEKNGEKKEFSVSEIPYQDTAWKYFDRIDKVIRKGYEPPIHDFSLTSADGNDLTDSVLNNEYSVLVIAYNLNKSNPEGLKKVNSFTEKMKKMGITAYGMTASSSDDIERLHNLYKFHFDFFTCDEIALKTTIRSNPGVILLQKGTVINMWHYRNLPEIKSNTNIESISLLNLQHNKVAYIIGFYFLLLIVVTLAVILITKKRK